MKMQYPLEERIGDPNLFVGRKEELANFQQWIDSIPRKRAKSRVILARRKSGKTVFMQRIFNQVWSENGLTIPFYFTIQEAKLWYQEFAIRYYRTFASHCISFLERNKSLVMNLWSLEKIRAYGIANNLDLFVDNIDEINQYKKEGYDGLIWDIAYRAPEIFASLYNRRVLVMIDEIQNITQYVYSDKERKTEPDKTMAGSFHEVVESKIAPMLVSGSYVGWLVEVIGKYLQAGRLKQIYMSPYLKKDDALQAVFKYASSENYPITHENALLINELCKYDPFFISCVIQSVYPHKDFCNRESILQTINYEITNKKSELSMTWGEYIEQTVKRINDSHAKNILLHMSKNNNQEFTPRELKNSLGLPLSENEIQERLQDLVKADLIEEGSSDIDYHGLKDGTLNLVLRNRFEKEISSLGIAPDFISEFSEEVEKLKKDKQRLRGQLSNIIGKTAEYQLMCEFRSKKRFALAEYFEGVSDNTILNIQDVKIRFYVQRPDGKNMEIDLIAESDCGRVILVEIKKMSKPVGLKNITDFKEKVDVYKQIFSEKIVLAGYFSLGGFTKDASEFCKANGIGVAENIKYTLFN